MIKTACGYKKEMGKSKQSKNKWNQVKIQLEFLSPCFSINIFFAAALFHIQNHTFGIETMRSTTKCK